MVVIVLGTLRCELWIVRKMELNDRVHGSRITFSTRQASFFDIKKGENGGIMWILRRKIPF